MLDKERVSEIIGPNFDAKQRKEKLSKWNQEFHERKDELEDRLKLHDQENPLDEQRGRQINQYLKIWEQR